MSQSRSVIAIEKSAKYACCVFGLAHDLVDPVHKRGLFSAILTWYSRKLTAKERLRLDAPNPPLRSIPQHQSRHAQHALPIHPHLHLPVLAAHIVQPHPLHHGRPPPARKGPRAAADARAVRRVAVREGRDGAHALVGREGRREVGV